MGLIKNVRREFETINSMRKMLALTKDMGPESERLLSDDLEASVDKYSNNVAFRFEDEVITYREYDARANQVANWAYQEGLRAGDCVALFMGNCPDYVAIWTGLAKIGVVTALINHNLTGEGLAHCVNIVGAKAVIAGGDLGESIESAKPFLAGDVPVWALGGVFDGAKDLESALLSVSDERPLRRRREHLRGNDLCLYVYTSGTTGLPKAARLTQTRTQGIMRTFIIPSKTTSRDRVYVTLPLYHSTGGLGGVGIALYTGACVILRRKFSASQFWDDAADMGATRFAYIGELCRYLLNQPPHPKERAHRIKNGFGNGLRPEIWQEFLDRFNIPRLAEFYGSTEGNVSFINLDGHVGSVGRIPKLLANKFDNIAFVKFDIANEEPVRNGDDLCILADPGEPAEVLGKIGDDMRTRFEGYEDVQATQKKILTDVFEKGDKWFRTGDLLMKDEEGYVYFVDRIGDTFRWKGENVSTNEVAGVVAEAPGVATANVYGVPIPGMDGKAGMAAITTDGDVDFETLYDWLAERLPAYAVPIFVRFQREAETTGTFKYRKVDLVKEGFDPREAADPIWFFHPDHKAYEALTNDHFETIISGGFRF